MYNDNPGHIRCNRQNNCGNTIAVFDYVHQREHHENRWETVVYLHEQAGLKPPILRAKTPEEIEQETVMDDFWDICRQQLVNPGEGKQSEGIKYLTEKRNLNEAELKRFGHYPGKAVMKPLMEARGHSWESVEKVLKYVDNRDDNPIVFKAETPEGFMLVGRRIDSQSKDKYKPFNEYTKKIPFNLSSALNKMDSEKEGRLLMVEGYFDAIRLDSRGIPVIAVTSNNIPKEYVKYLTKKKIQKVTLLLDNDDAGSKGTLKTIDKLLKVGIQVEVVPSLPDAKDPDEFLNKHGLEAFKELLNNAQPWWQCKVSQMNLEELLLSERKEAIFQVFYKIRGAIEREHAAPWFGEQLGVTKDTFLEDASYWLNDKASVMLSSKELDIPYSERVIQVLTEFFGYHFSRDVLRDKIYVNGHFIDDFLRSEIYLKLADLGCKNEKMITHVINKLADQNSTNSIRDYFKSIEYAGDGYIEKLASYFKTNDDDWFGIILRKFLIGAIARVFRVVQPPMLVLSGGQGTGKSHFAKWLCSSIPDHFYDGFINPRDKDDTFRMAHTFIWEVAELSGTTKKADRDALKHFLTLQTVKDLRKAYTKDPVDKHIYTAFIGTVNNFTGFLDDPTGSRRFNITEVLSIDWKYKQDIEIDALWAEAYHAYIAGEKWQLTADEAAKQSQINQDYEMYSFAGELIREKVRFTGKTSDFIPSTNLLRYIQDKGYKGNSRLGYSEILAAMRSLGCKEHKRNGIKGYDSCKFEGRFLD